MGSKKETEGFKFYIEEDGETAPVVYEDIVSDSGASQRDIYSNSVSLSSFSNKKRYEKRKKGFWAGIGRWWRHRRAWQKSMMITALVLVIVFSVAFGVIASMFDYNYNEITSKPEDLGFENVLDERIVNVALFGIDTREPNSFKGLSDSIMILSLNTKTKQVKIISVMRDSLVPITYNGKTTYHKINTAYQKGGPELAIKTLNTIFGLDISEYATVNFYGMVDIIDAVGGIDATLTKGEVKKSDGTLHSINGCIDEICGNLGIDSSKHHILTEGEHHLNGVQAVAYSRIRYVSNIWGTNNDYGRTDRQRYVMEQLFNKAITLGKSQYVKLAKSLIPCSETSLSYKEIMGLAFDILLHSPTFQQTRVPQVEYQIMNQPNAGVGSVVYYDLDFASKLIHSFIYDDITPEAYIEANGVEKNDWYRNKFGYSTYPPTSASKNESTSEPSDEPTESTDSSTDETVSGDGTESTPSEGVDGTESGDGSTSEPTDSPSTPDGTESGTVSTPEPQPPEQDDTPDNSQSTTTE